jgi:tetratricopeptide (TPR) repeat protein
MVTNGLMHDTNDVNEVLAELRQAGQHPDQALLDRVKDLGAAAVRPLITMATDESLYGAESESPEVWAPLHAMQILGELEAAEAVEPLLPLLASDDEWLDQLLPECLGRIGAPALPPLRAYLFDRAHDVWVRSRAAAALKHMAQSHPDLRADVVEALVARLDPAETRAPDDEKLNALVISELLDLKAVEAGPVILQAFDEDRVDRRIVDVDSVYQELDLPGKPSVIPADRGIGLRLWLRCTACGYERDHYVEKVYCDLGTVDRRKRGEEVPYSEYIIPQQITCPKCNAVDQYALTGDAYLAFTAQLLKSMARGTTPKPAGGPLREVVEALANPRKDKDHGDPLPDDDEDERVVYTRFTVAGGREMHPLEAADMYSRQVEAEPDNADLRVRYGNVLRHLGRREAAALQYRAAVQADPANVEACASLADLAREAGDRTEAHRMLRRVLELAPDSQLSRQDREEYVQFALEELAELDGPAQSTPRRTELAFAMGPQRRGSNGPPSSPQPVRHAGKVGRNDPGPYGSGRKYKKCCGR